MHLNFRSAGDTFGSRRQRNWLGWARILRWVSGMLRQLFLTPVQSCILATRFIYKQSYAKSHVTNCELSALELQEGCRLGIDSHADTCCVGALKG